jgi:ELWxxDGT repeat protein
LIVTAVLASRTAPLHAQLTAPAVLKDINAQGGTSNPDQFKVVGGVAYFAAASVTTGVELWKTDGTPGGTMLVKDIWPGVFGSSPTNLTDFNGVLFFVANNGVSGGELWKTDGTAAGTVMVKDIGPGAGGSSPSGLIVSNGVLFFGANDGIISHELWRSDGTSAGTTLVKDIRPGPDSSGALPLVDVNGVLYLMAFDAINGNELWRSDGTAGGTVLVKDINPGANAHSNPGSFGNAVNLNGTLIFRATDASGDELWRSDGTAAGTTIIKDINLGPTGAGPSLLTVVNGVAFFQANDGVRGVELWRTDGSAAGTVLIRDINPGLAGSNPAPLVSSNGKVYFSANDGVNGTELWRTDGTSGGTSLVKDIVPGIGSSSPLALADANGTLFFSATDVTGRELWKSDGTAAGTVLVTDLQPDGGSNPARLTNLNGVVIFSAFNSLTGTELFRSDGTPAGTGLLADINPNTGDSNPRNFVDVNGITFFVASDGVTGIELWRTNGLTGGTTLVKDIRPGDSNPSNLTNVNGTLFFTASDAATGTELWRSDGTSAGTVLVKDIVPGASSSTPSFLTNVGGVLFFAAFTSGAGVELWKSDGTSAGTVMVKDIWPGAASSGPASLTNVNGLLLFAAGDPTLGNELWRSDGTDPGTFMVQDIWPGNISSGPANLIVVNAKLFFTASDPSSGNELWRSDGTSIGTTLVRDIRPGVTSSQTLRLTNVNGTLFFAATDGTTGIELWRSDGTSAGTALVADIFAGNGSSNPSSLTEANGTLFFAASDSANGNELWRSNGTGAGTVLVKNIQSGSASSSPTLLTRVGNALYFSATDQTGGTEIFRSDGTAAGTVVKDLRPGLDSSAPKDLASINGTLYFNAIHAVMGAEPWIIVEADLAAPVISGVPSNLTAQAISPSGATATWTAPTALDNVNGAIPVACIPSSGSTFALGTTTVTCSAQDAVGNISAKQFLVTVVDTIGPSLTVPPSMTQEATSPAGAVVSFMASAIDAVSGPTAVLCTPLSGSTFALGTTLVTCTTHDSAANISSASFQIFVKDTTAPVLSPGSLPDITLEAGGPFGTQAFFTAPSASDVVDTSVSTICLPASGSMFSLGQTNVMCSATDDSGNAAVTMFRVTVVDLMPPVVLVPANATFEATSSAGAIVTFTATAVDTVSGIVSATCPTSGQTFALGATTATCTATDGLGNTGAASFTVTVVDTTPPALTVTDLTVVATEAAGIPVDFMLTAQDLVSGPIVPDCSPTSGSVFTIETHTVSCTATDAAGNSATYTFNVMVLDGVAPVVSAPSNQLVEATSSAGATVTFAVTASDNIDDMLTVTCTPNSGAVFALGQTPVTCSATDAANNTGSAIFDVTVQDTTRPDLVLPAIVTATVTSGTSMAVTYSATATDLVDGGITPVCAPASGSTFSVGTTQVSCTAADTHGNEAAGSFTVKVNDGVSPVVTVTPAGDRVVEATSSAGATVTYSAAATDNIDTGLVTTCVPASGSVFPLGETAVTCAATDSDNNTGRATFTVRVVDTTGPALTVPSAQSAIASQDTGVAVSFAVSAIDLVDGPVAATCAPASGSVFAPGATLVSCTAADSRGNGATGSFTVTVTMSDNRIGRFVAFSRDHTVLRQNVKVITGDVGANQAKAHSHAGVDDDGNAEAVTVRVGQKATMQEPSSRLIGDRVWLMPQASVYNVVHNVLVNKQGTVLGAVTSPVSLPYLTLPAFPVVTPGTAAVTVAKNQTLTLPAGSYGRVQVNQGGTLVLTGGLYQMLSLDLDQRATVLFRGVTEIRIKTELSTNVKARLILDQSVPGLSAAQMRIYVEGDDTVCQHTGSADDDGDDAGRVSVHIGQQNVVQANIYAANGSVWLKSKTQATGAFIGVHTRIGAGVTLTLESAFQ